MKIAAMRWLDRWLGMALCICLSPWQRLFGCRPAPGRQRVLVITLYEMGALVLAEPALRRLAEQHELYFVAFRRSAPVLDIIAPCTGRPVFVLDERGLWSLLRTVWRFWRWCRQQRFGCVVDMELFARSAALLALLSGARQRIGFHAFHQEGLYRGNWITRPVLYNPHQSMGHNFMALADALLQPEPDRPASKQPRTVLPRITPYQVPVTVQQRLMAVLQTHMPGFRGGQDALWLLHVECNPMLPQRQWAPARYRDLVQRVANEQPTVWLGLIGTTDEQAGNAAFVQTLNGAVRCVNLAGLFSLPELMALFRLAAVLISHDSGPVHLAALADLPVVALYGPETPALYGPVGPARVLYRQLRCSPCVSAYNHRQSPCRKPLCMQDIIVDEVLECACALAQERTKKRTNGSSV